MRKNALIIYLFVVTVFLFLTGVSIGKGAGIEAGVVAGIGLVSCVTSLIPFFISRYLFNKAAPYTHYRQRYKIAGIIFYVFCFPVKIWAIYVTLYLLVHGESRWAFG